MKRVRLIRHGESAANAGHATQDHASITLTLKGVEQAHQVARSFSEAPELIIASPFSRAQATAAVTASAFPTAIVETWPIHEFTYLEPARCVNTTLADRRSWVDAFWLRSDPSFSDGAGAESFADFLARAQSFLDRLDEHPAQLIATLSHGQFLNAVAWLLERRPQVIDTRAMRDWRDYEITHHIPNGSGYSLSKRPGDTAWTLGQRT
ncbi:histidine phosphatase family protein [Pseudomonas sp. RC3H12]|uniref:histidine phosphatase family protein n=1 Tax=Pseudomonas sp. RC3H12 TaxID=2834406 RepID=UPI001BDF4872|nr:histidine phosphatase family protein [Pseudomonas sp. RC3H12]QWA30535.1 phosphoglycerate mutase family protein [Pseudomonas sp. RC3H12]